MEVKKIEALLNPFESKPFFFPLIIHSYPFQYNSLLLLAERPFLRCFLKS